MQHNILQHTMFITPTDMISLLVRRKCSDQLLTKMGSLSIDSNLSAMLPIAQRTDIKIHNPISIDCIQGIPIVMESNPHELFWHWSNGFQKDAGAKIVAPCTKL